MNMSITTRDDIKRRLTRAFETSPDILVTFRWPVTKAANSCEYADTVINEFFRSLAEHFLRLSITSNLTLQLADCCGEGLHALPRDALGAWQFIMPCQKGSTPNGNLTTLQTVIESINLEFLDRFGSRVISDQDIRGSSVVYTINPIDLENKAIHELSHRYAVPSGVKLADQDDDPVNHPSHYTRGGIECIDAIKASMSLEAFRGFLQGNAMKYIWRHDLKGKPVEDLEKAMWYLTRLRNEI